MQIHFVQALPSWPCSGSLLCWQHPQPAILPAGSRACQDLHQLHSIGYCSTWTRKPRVLSTCLILVRWLCAPSPMSTIPGYFPGCSLGQRCSQKRVWIGPLCFAEKGIHGLCYEDQRMIWFISLYLFVDTDIATGGRKVPWKHFKTGFMCMGRGNFWRQEGSQSHCLWNDWLTAAVDVGARSVDYLEETKWNFPKI